MKILKTIEDLKRERQTWTGTVGFVPTMGYLHEGHLSLVERSLQDNDDTVVSVFVNPTQFAAGEDLDRYPRDLERDGRLLAEMGVTALFLPDNREVYPEGFSTFVVVEKLSDVLCGRSRPTHFRGVTTVVLKLFQLVRPDRAYFGQKDAQQAIIIKRMIRDLHLPVRLVVLPIVRDQDGLALSSRNEYLSKKERASALCLPRALSGARFMISEGVDDASRVVERIDKELKREEGVVVDYIAVVDLKRLEPLQTVLADNTLVAAAIRVGNTRLIDNFILGEI